MIEGALSMKKALIAVAACALLFSCSFPGIGGSAVPAAKYLSVSEYGGTAYRTEVTLAEGTFLYEHYDADVCTKRYEGEFGALAGLGLNTYETSLTKLESNQSATALNTVVAQLKLTYNSPVLIFYLDVDGSGSVSDNGNDINGHILEK